MNFTKNWYANEDEFLLNWFLCKKYKLDIVKKDYTVKYNANENGYNKTSSNK